MLTANEPLPTPTFPAIQLTMGRPRVYTNTRCWRFPSGFHRFPRISCVWSKPVFLHGFGYTPGLGASPPNLVYSRGRVKKQTWTIHQKSLEIDEIPIEITRPRCWCILGAALDTCARASVPGALNGTRRNKAEKGVFGQSCFHGPKRR